MNICIFGLLFIFANNLASWVPKTLPMKTNVHGSPFFYKMFSLFF